MEEGEIVHRDHERAGPAGGNHSTGRMDDVDRSGEPLDRWPPEAVPGLVEGKPGQREMPDVEVDRERVGSGPPMAGRHADDLPVVSVGERAEAADSGGGGPSRDPVPALFDHGCDTSGHGPESVTSGYDLLSMETPFHERRFYITGGTGFLGGAVIAALRRRGVTDIVAPSSREVDFRDREATDTAIAEAAPHTVIHLAARVGGIGANMAAPADLYFENLMLGTNVIEASRLAGVAKTVVIGTICSYPKHTPVPFQETSLWTGYPEETNAPYGIAKLAHLVHLQANQAQYGQQGAYLMPTNLYGPGDKFHPDVSHVIPALIRKCVIAREEATEEIEVWGTGGASREFLYVDDAADGIVRATELWAGPEPVNLGADRELLIKELVEIIAELTEFEGRIRWDESKPDGQPRRSVDASRARELFGFEAHTDFREGLRATIDWYEDNRELAESKRN